MCLGCSEVSAWGEVGHKAIAELARDYLSPAAKAAVAHYLGAMQMYQGRARAAGRCLCCLLTRGSCSCATA